MKRSDVEERFKWQLYDIVAGDEEWNRLFQETKKEFQNLSVFKGKLSQPKEFLNCMKCDEKISQNMYKLYAYANMHKDENLADAKYTSLSGKVESLNTEYSSLCSYILPELTALSDDAIKKLMTTEELKEYDYMLEKVLKNKKHILSEEIETILAENSEITGMFSDIFEMLDNADLNLGKIEHNGEEIQLSHAKYGLLMKNKDRELRKKAFEKYYQAYKNVIHTLASIYNANVKKDCFYAKVRNYQGCLDKALSREDVSPNVYQNLLSSVSENINVLNDYISFKKKVLGYDKFYMYDMHCSIVEGAEIEVPYEKAYQMVVDALQVLGSDYTDLLKNAYEKRWIDVYETENKRSGAYSCGVYGVHPFVLLNYEKTTNNVFTIAHEMGHALHSYYSSKNQPFSKADYVIFVAEVASTVNEVLLLKHIVKNTTDKNVKKYLLYYLLEMFRTTLFRQTQFAEFEYIAHKMAEDGEPLNYENLSKEYLKLNQKYYGSAVEEDDCIKFEWSRIPHFYTAFYVYKYATGIISAISIADSILNEGQKAVDDYKKFLSSGGSNSPVELLKIAGVDLNSKQPFEKAMKVFEDTLRELKELM